VVSASVFGVFGLLFFISFLPEYIFIIFYYFIIYLFIFFYFFSIYFKSGAFLSYITFFVLFRSFFSHWLEMLNFHSPSVGPSTSIDLPGHICAMRSNISNVLSLCQIWRTQGLNTRIGERIDSALNIAKSTWDQAWHALGHLTGRRPWHCRNSPAA
jgi:hypothetical protein